MPGFQVNGIRIEIEDSGPEGAPVLLLVRGLAAAPGYGSLLEGTRG